jgi:EmrB/QacA subfamily drug resistance transporter
MKRKNLSLVTVCLGTFVAMLDNIVVNNALPAIGRDFGVGVGKLQWVIEGYSLVFAALLMTGGTLGDRLGRKRVFTAGMAVFAAGSIAAGLAPSYAVLVCARVVQGVGAAMLTPSSLAILRHVFTDEKERARAIGTWSGMSALGLAVGPLLSGPIVETFGWTGVFWINVPVFAAALVLAARVLHESAAPAGRGVDWPGQLLCIIGLGSLVTALVEGQSLGWRDGRILLCTAVGIASIVAFTAVELRVESPMLDLRLFRERALGAAALTGFMVGFAVFGVSFFLPLLLQDVMGWSPTDAGFAGLPMTAMVVVAGPLSGMLTARTGPRIPLAVGLVLCSTALFGLSAYGPGAHYWEYLWVLLALGLGMGMTFTPVSVTVMKHVAPARAGMASAALNTVREMGGVVGIAVLGVVLAHRMAAELAEAGLPARTHRSLTASSAASTPAESPALAVAKTVDAAFVDGLHLALRSGGAAMLVTATVVTILLRPGVPALPSRRHDSTPEGRLVIRENSTSREKSFDVRRKPSL